MCCGGAKSREVVDVIVYGGQEMFRGGEVGCVSLLIVDDVRVNVSTSNDTPRSSWTTIQGFVSRSET